MSIKDIDNEMSAGGDKMFDWNLYWKDIDSRATPRTLLKRMKGGRYYVDKSKMADVKS